MAKFINEPSHTFNEYLLIPGYSSSECIPKNVTLKTPLTKFKKGENPKIEMNIPMVSAIMQSVSGDRLAVALASLATFINATAIPAGESVKTIIAWCGLLLAAVGIIVRMIAGKTNAAANILVMLSTVYACVCYFIF